jgi:hypothetical protein
MAADLRSVVLKVAKSALEQSGSQPPPPEPKQKKPMLSTGRAILLGAGLATAGQALVTARGRELVGSVRERLQDQDGQEEEQYDEPEAEEDEDFDDEDNADEPEAEEDEDFDDEDNTDEPEAEEDEDFDDEDDTDEPEAEEDDDEPEAEEDEDFDEEDEPPRRRQRSRSVSRNRG